MTFLIVHNRNTWARTWSAGMGCCPATPGVSAKLCFGTSRLSSRNSYFVITVILGVILRVMSCSASLLHLQLYLGDPSFLTLLKAGFPAYLDFSLWQSLTSQILLSRQPNVEKSCTLPFYPCITSSYETFMPKKGYFRTSD